MKQKYWACFCLSFLVVLVVWSSNGFCAAQLGQSCALTGPTSFLGIEMHKGAKAYFERHAKNIILTKKDDGYEPERCRTNTDLFIREGVDALFGYVGTPTSKVAVPLSTQNNVVYFGAFTGASFLSDVQKNPYSFSVRGSYNAEVENMMRRLKEDLGVTRIALFVQRDAFGLAGIRAAVRAEKIIDGIEIIPAVPRIPSDSDSQEIWKSFWRQIPNYRRNTVSVGLGVRQIKGNGVGAVILVGAYRPCATAINQLHKLGFNAPMINISFVGSVDLANRLNNTNGVYISQVVPDPWDATIPIVREYQHDLGSSDYGFVSFEGYIAAKVFHQAIKTIHKTVNSDSIKRSLETMSHYDAGGINISFGVDDHRGMDSVYLTTIGKSGDTVQFTYIDKLLSKK